MSSLVQDDPHEDKQDRTRSQRMVILDILSLGGNGNGQGKTFDQCLQQFNNKFGRAHWFRVCCDISYLLEANVSEFVNLPSN